MKLSIIKMGEMPITFDHVVQVDYNDFKENHLMSKLHMMTFIIKNGNNKTKNSIDLSEDIQVIITGD
jgi:hypothetical protein